MTSSLLKQLSDLVQKYKLYENAIIFNGMDAPYFDLRKAVSIFKQELEKRVHNKISAINEDIEIAEEENDSELIKRLTEHRKRVRALLQDPSPEIKSIDELEFPSELLVDHSSFGFQ